MDMNDQTERQKWVLRARTLIKFIEKNQSKKEFDQPATIRKAALLTSLLAGEIAPGEFIAQVQENGFSTRILSTKEALQERMEFLGRDTKISLGDEIHTCQEAFDRFEEFEIQIADFFKRLTPNEWLNNLDFSNDPDAIINKISDSELSDEVRLIFWERHCERWGK